MIHRSLILFILLIVIPDVYLYRVWARRGSKLWLKIVWWGVSIFLLAYTLWLAACPDFMPANPWPLFIYLLVLGVYTLPKMLFTLVLMLASVVRLPGRYFSKTGSLNRAIKNQLPMEKSKSTENSNVSEKYAPSHRCAVIVAALLSVALVWMVGYGVTVGFHKFEVRRVDLTMAQLPYAFDGYKVALFSDAHVGSYATRRGREVLAMAMDSINALGADLIVFTGDLQNVRAEEIDKHSGSLSRLKAPDGVMAVMGNHDYPMYIDASPEERSAAELATDRKIRSLGWELLRNEHRFITRGTDTLVVAGMENLGKPRFPSKGDAEQAMTGVNPGSFVVMLEHDPYAWREAILPKTQAQLTLSGHTHGGQVNFLGVSPYSVIGGEFEGLYHHGDRALFVTRGLGGLIPFRFGATGEIVLITLHRTK